MRRVQVRQLATHQWGDRYIVRENSFSPSGPIEGPDVSIAVTSGVTTNNGSTYKAALNNAVTLTCTVVGESGTLSFQWKKDGVVIPGATNATYNPPVNFLTTPNGNVYTCVASDNLGDWESNALTIIVEVLLFVNTEIAGEYVELSDFSLEVTTFGESPTAYQWFQDGVPISGATANPYNVFGAQLYQTGIYSLVVTTASGQAVTDQYYVQIVSQDDARAPSVAIGPTSPPPRVSQGDTLTIMISTSAGTGPRAYQWQTSPTGAAPWTNIVGETTETLSIPNAQTAVDQTYYRLSLSTPLGTVHSNVLFATVYDVPFIIGQTTSFTSAVGLTETLSVSALGQAPLSYQWQKETSPGVWGNVGTNANTFQIVNVQLSDAGNYRVRVSNVNGLVTSETITITVTELLLAPSTDNPVQVAGINFTRGVIATGPAPYSYQWQRETSPGVWSDLVGQTAATLAFNAPTPATSGNYRVAVTNPLITKYLVISITVVAGIIAINENGLIPVWGGPLNIDTAVQTSVAATYQWYKNNVAISGATSQNYTIPVSLPADDGAVYKVVGTNIYGTFEDDWTFTGGVVVKWLSAPAVKIVAGSNYTLTVPYEAYDITSFSWKKDGVAFPGTGSTQNFNPLMQADQGTYKLTITNPYGTSESPSGRFLEVENIKFTAQPVDVTAYPGALVGFLCTATGPGTLAYQWYKDAVLMPGKTSPALTIDDIGEGDVAGYYCIVSNEYGSRQSATGNLLITAVVTSIDDFTVPIRANIVNIIVASTQTLNVGQIVYVDNDGGVGFFSIQAISGNQITLLYSTAPSGGESLQVLPVGTLVNGLSAIRLGGFSAEITAETVQNISLGGTAVEVTAETVQNVSLGGFAVEVTLSDLAPNVITRPTISGIQDPGNTITSSNGTWAFTPTSYTYQWYRNNTTPVVGATSANYNVTSADLGFTLRCGVIATNANGSSAEVFTPATVVIGTLPEPLKYASVVHWSDAQDAGNTTSGSNWATWADKSTNGRTLAINGAVVNNFEGNTGLKACAFNGTSNTALLTYTGNVGTVILVLKQGSPLLSSFKGIFTGSAANPQAIAESTTKYYNRDAVTGVATGTDGVNITATFVNGTQTGVIPTGYVVLIIRGTPQAMVNVLLASDRGLGGRFGNFSLVALMVYSTDLGSTAVANIVSYCRSSTTYFVP